MMAVRLGALLPLLSAPVAAQDDRSLMRQALALLAERPISEELVATYEELHGRAWRLGDAETAHAAVDGILAWWEERYGPESSALGTRLNDLGVALRASASLVDVVPSLRLLGVVRLQVVKGELYLASQELALGHDLMDDVLDLGACVSRLSGTRVPGDEAVVGLEGTEQVVRGVLARVGIGVELRSAKGLSVCFHG